eukprot:CAMPEP_0172048320 /NCGR_PEP_ID=MMETSP1043-20130122/1468_1 /TAXON_ID=464988 /ORGANISM="Hemiselmis andersenii, Strain CCMP441" /LENGTH=190 /DNA_ID=CAMNT_0012707211 /DNA_START=147 /DNA_END=720 /DNA_ORIENTATION=-
MRRDVRLRNVAPRNPLVRLQTDPKLPYVAPVGMPGGGAVAGACVTAAAACVPLSIPRPAAPWADRPAVPPACDAGWVAGGCTMGTWAIVCAETAACTPVPAAAHAEFVAAVALATVGFPPTVTQPCALDIPKGEGPMLGTTPFLPTPKAPLTDAACELLTPATVPQLCTGTPSAPPVPPAAAPALPDEHV